MVVVSSSVTNVRDRAAGALRARRGRSRGNRVGVLGRRWLGRGPRDLHGGIRGTRGGGAHGPGHAGGGRSIACHHVHRRRSGRGNHWSRGLCALCGGRSFHIGAPLARPPMQRGRTDDSQRTDGEDHASPTGTGAAPGERQLLVQERRSNGRVPDGGVSRLASHPDCPGVIVAEARRRYGVWQQQLRRTHAGRGEQCFDALDGRVEPEVTLTRAGSLEPVLDLGPKVGQGVAKLRQRPVADFEEGPPEWSRPRRGHGPPASGTRARRASKCPCGDPRPVGPWPARGS